LYIVYMYIVLLWHLAFTIIVRTVLKHYNGTRALTRNQYSDTFVSKMGEYEYSDIFV
jgi:hypothetical protein